MPGIEKLHLEDVLEDSPQVCTHVSQVLAQFSWYMFMPERGFRWACIPIGYIALVENKIFSTVNTLKLFLKQGYKNFTFNLK
jgi:hypothetical protein